MTPHWNRSEQAGIFRRSCLVRGPRGIAKNALGNTINIIQIGGENLRGGRTRVAKLEESVCSRGFSRWYFHFAIERRADLSSFSEIRIIPILKISERSKRMSFFRLSARTDDHECRRLSEQRPEQLMHQPASLVVDGIDHLMDLGSNFLGR